MGKVLRVDTERKVTWYEELSGEYSLFGGRALTARIICDEVEPTCHPLGKGNKLVIASGVLAGTMLSSSGRISIGAKSPLTGTIKESNAGGSAAPKMARLGIRAVIIEGLPVGGEYYILHITGESARLIPADEYRGLGNYALVERLQERYGREAAIISIGPAGEKLLAAAGIAITDKDGIPGRFAGRGGLGAVMGSKGIKALVIDDAGCAGIDYHNKKEFQAICKQLHQELLANPTIQTYARLGTAGTLAYVNALGGLPTHNFRQGRYHLAGEINGDKLYNNIVSRGGEGRPTHACTRGCIIRCSNVYPDSNGRTLVSPLEYETLGLLGSNCGIGDLDQIAYLNYLCNDFGLDTIEVGAALAVAMEAGVLPFGDYQGMVNILHEIAQGSILGRVIGSGTSVTARVFGITRVPTVKGQAMPAYDPRAIKGNGVTYATTPMGADHTAANLIRAEAPTDSAGKLELSRNTQYIIATYDSLGLCTFLGPVLNKRLDLLARLLAARTGKEIPAGFEQELGRTVIELERRFNRQAGFSEGSDTLPDFMREEPLEETGYVFDIPDKDLMTLHNG